MTDYWNRGQLLTRGELLGLQPAEVTTAPPIRGVWLEFPVYVVEDGPNQLVTFTAPGAEFRFPDGRWPTDDGLHPWRARSGWTGHGCLMMQRPGDHHAIWHFWKGPERRFGFWYINLQTDFLRSPHGYVTNDLELDIVVFPGGTYEIKDDDVLEKRISDGRFSPDLVDWIRTYGQGLIGRLEADGPWWDTSWATWTPEPTWVNPRLPV